ncbi:MAG: hypothetical protein ACI92G_003404 [Candidatus Pelagisphaera sp.]|jgi:hypothetical protein
MRIFEREQWQALEAERKAFIMPWLEAYRDRRARRISHPVHDFLFKYYQMNRQILSRWRPMADMRLKGDEADAFLEDERYRRFDDGVGLNLDSMSEPERGRVDWVRNLIARSLGRSPRFSCFGLHEWAMVYKTDQIRHETTPLRLERSEIEQVVESNAIHCTHHDAFRFFTEAARPLNAVQPGSENRADNEQFGCVHFNMDLYRWCYKLNPWVGSELIDDCFRLAIEARILDMRASPYDVSQYGYDPIAIETVEGRELYRVEQKALYERGQPIAKRLLAECERLLGRAGACVMPHS